MEPSTPRFLVLSVAAFETLESSRASDANTPENAHPASAGTTPLAVRAVAVSFGLACLAIGPILWVALPPGGGRLIAGYLGAFGLLFGAVFLRYAVVA